MKFRLFSICLILMLVIGNCTNPKKTVQLPVTPEVPEWISSRPSSGSYYIGIGQSSVAPGVDFQAVAKKNALNDLASEIQVNVNSNSILYTLEREYKFSEEFSETINTSTNLDLTGYEQVNSWQDGTTYWVYYRLSKLEYAQARAAEKKDATAQALALFIQGKSAVAAGNFYSATASYLTAMQKLKKFNREPVPAVLEGDTVQLGTELFMALRQLFSDIQIVTSPSAGISLNYFNNFSQDVEIKTLSSNHQTALGNVPLSYHYFGTNGIQSGSQSSSPDGKINLKIINADRENKRNRLEITVDIAMLKAMVTEDEFLQKLLQKIQPPPVVLPIQFVNPTVFITGSKTKLNTATGDDQIKSAIQSALLEKNIPVANTSDSAQLVIDVTAKTRKGSNSEGFFISYLDVFVTVQDQQTGKGVFTKNIMGIKGVSTDFDKAGEKAIEKFAENVEVELIKPLVHNILN